VHTCGLSVRQGILSGKAQSAEFVRSKLQQRTLPPMVGGVGVGQVHVTQPLLRMIRGVCAVAVSQLTRTAKELGLLQLLRLDFLGDLLISCPACLRSGQHCAQ
jgi:hypothetical protein